MNKALIYKYLSSELSKEEKDQLFDWISRNDENEKFFIEQANFWIWQHTPQKRASIEDYVEFQQMVQQRKKMQQRAQRKNRFLFIQSSAAILFCFLALNLVFFYYNYQNTNENSVPLIAEKRTCLKELYTNNGVKAKITLPDSSVVWLNSGSKISYPDDFGKTAREVVFSGEAYFDVMPDNSRPMIIQNKEFIVKVLGTRFNLKNYDNDPSAQITLYSGKVEVLRRNNSGKEEVTTMLPNETVTISPYQATHKNLLTDPSVLSEWREGKLFFLETKMPEVIKMLERWHGVTFKVRDIQILDYKFTARFNSESIVQILDFLKMTTFIDYSISGNEITLEKR